MFSYWSAVNQTTSHPHTSAHQYPRFRVLIVLFIFLKPETPLRSFSKLHQPPIISEVIVWTNCLKDEIIMKVNMKSDAAEIKTTYFCFALWKWKSATRVCRQVVFFAVGLTANTMPVLQWLPDTVRNRSLQWGRQLTHVTGEVCLQQNHKGVWSLHAPQDSEL